MERREAEMKRSPGCVRCGTVTSQTAKHQSARHDEEKKRTRPELWQTWPAERDDLPADEHTR
jgi:hypothetical protein